VWFVGQWQNGEYVGEAPADMPGVKPAMVK
jgi:hypothetical protein